MGYRFGKARALNGTERWRLRTAIRLQHALRQDLLPEDGDGSERLRQLHATVLDPNNTANASSVDWLLCHAPPALLRQFILRVQRRTFRRGLLSLVGNMQPDTLLPREHITPDWQIVLGKPRPASALVALTGHALRLNIPLQLFHSLVARDFDAFVYLRDTSRLHFRSGVAGFGDSASAVASRLRQELATCTHVALLGTSSSANATLEIALSLGAHRTALFSPDLLNDMPEDFVRRIDDHTGEIQTFFARQSRQDRELARGWEAAFPRHPPRWLSRSSHGTLAHLVHAGEFPYLRSWLAGGDMDL